ncbi:MAG: hypothetical protein LWX70_05720 [Sphingobacteriia bacterium]|nr:hypothetical protein [Sphingobacteriia bacterium]
MKKRFTPFILTMLVFMASVVSIAQNSPNEVLEFKVVLSFKATSVVFHEYNPVSNDIPMTQLGENTYIAQIGYYPGGYNFNISWNDLEYNHLLHWAGAGNTYSDSIRPSGFFPHGIKSCQIYVNGQLLNNRFTIQNSGNNGLNIAFTLNIDGTIIPNYTFNPHLKIDDRVPVEAHHHAGHTNIYGPPVDKEYLTGWIAVVSDNTTPNNSSVEIDYLRVYGWSNNDWQLISTENYDYFSSPEKGKLYVRYPFFPAGFDGTGPMSGSANSGILTFSPSDERRSVWHLWTPQTYSAHGSFDGYKVVARMRILGEAAAQVGLDFKNLQSTTFELGVSDWYFGHTAEWQEVVFDSRSFGVGLLEGPSAPHGSVRFDWSSANGCISLTFEKMKVGNYSAQVFDAFGRVVLVQEFYLGGANGEFHLPVGDIPDQLLICRLICDGREFRGKVTRKL